MANVQKLQHTEAKTDVLTGPSSNTESPHKDRTGCTESVQGDSQTSGVEACQAETTSTEAAGLTCLPDLVLLKVLGLLSVGDRCHLSLVCRRLRELLSHPSVWRWASLCCRCTGRCLEGVHAQMSHREKRVATLYGRHFQDLTLIAVSCVGSDFEEDTKQVLTKLSAEWQLLTLRLILVDVESYRACADVDTFEDSVASRIGHIAQRTTSLRRLDVVVWPKTESLEKLLNSVSSIDLRSLSIAVEGKREWHQGKILRHEFPMYALAARCRSLQHLSILERMLTPMIIRSLADGQRLRTLSINVSHPSICRPKSVDLKYSAAWQHLLDSIPHLQVKFSFVHRYSDGLLSQLFLPGIPVTTVTIHEFSSCSSRLLSLLLQYARTLESFICHVTTDGQDNDLPLVSLVKSCRHLRHLGFWGGIHSSTVVELARDRQWRTFRFREKSIRTGPEEPEAEGEGNMADRATSEGKPLSQTEDRQKWQARQVPEESRAEELERMQKEVSRCVGYNWTSE